MGLPTVLINQFAKSTNDTKNELKIETLYGKAKIVDGKQYVQLDGSDLLTPCTSSVTLKNDDRVIVSVGRHEAVITGNLTGPAVNEGDVTGIVDKTIGETVNQSLDAYDVKLKQMNELAANTLGFYYTEEKDENGATISYRHDKPTLADSTIIYKTGIEGFFLSVDGGSTWKAGFDSNGDAVLNILYAIGIQSKWINTRGFTATDNNGKETFKIDEATGAVYIDPSVFMLGDKEFAETITQAVANGSNVVILLSNESQNVSTDASGNILGSFDCSTTVSVMSGVNDITSQCQIGVTTLSGISNYNWDDATKTLTVTGISQDNCYAEFTAIYNDITVKRRFNITKQRAGTNGKGIESITVYYATNNSTSAPTSGWSTSFTAPSETAKYLWTYQVTRFTDGTSETTTPHVIGTYGRDGGQMSAAEVWELLLSMHTDFIYKGSDGNIYIKATYIDTGNLCGWTANRINKRLSASCSGSGESDSDVPSMIDLNNNGGSVTLDASKALVQTEPNTTVFNRFPYAKMQGDKVVAREARFNRLFVKTSADSEYAYNVKMGHNSNGSYFASPAIYEYPALASSALPVYINSNGTMSGTKSSSKRFKREFVENPELNYDAMFEIPIYEYKYKEGYFEDPADDDKTFIGVLAEDIASVDKRLAIYDPDGQVRMWDEQQLVPFLLGMIQKNHREIKELKDELKTINERLSALENK